MSDGQKTRGLVLGKALHNPDQLIDYLTALVFTDEVVLRDVRRVLRGEPAQAAPALREAGPDAGPLHHRLVQLPQTYLELWFLGRAAPVSRAAHVSCRRPGINPTDHAAEHGCAASVLISAPD